MIYLVSNSIVIDTWYRGHRITNCSVERALDDLSKLDVLGFDSETTGFSPYINKLLCIQLGNREVQYVIDTESVDIQLFKHILETKILLGQNLKFDLRFLYHHRIVPTIVYDTFLAEKCLTNGIKDIRRGLGELVERYTDGKLDKTVRGFIHRAGLTPQVIAYAAEDVMYLEEIMTKQLDKANELGMSKAIRMNNRFVLPLAYIEYCGIGFDKERWEAKAKRDLEGLESIKRELDEYILQNNLDRWIDAQLDLFSTERRILINWSSHDQVQKLFKELGMDISLVEKGEQKESVSAKVLAKIDHPLAKLYLSYSEQAKLVSTYGFSFLKHINHITGRIHTNYTQIMDTGRLSSGGKNRSTGEEYVNMQNIPADEDHRYCFIAEPGNVLIVSDYSGQEQVVLANKCMDKNILQFYDEGLGDMHGFVASKMFRELEGLTLDEIKSKHKDKRQTAKIAGFSINYGGTGETIARNQGLSIEEGNFVYNSYFEAFPDLKNYFDKAKQEGLEKGYILIDDVTGFKCFVEYFEEFKDREAKLTRQFWEKYRVAKANQTQEFQEMRELVSKYFRRKGDIERMSLNYTIQGTSASITKISLIYLFDYLVKNNLLFIVKIVNTVHDENVLEVPEHLAEKMAEVLQKCMEDAGAIYCKRVKLKAVPEISTVWKK